MAVIITCSVGLLLSHQCCTDVFDAFLEQNTEQWQDGAIFYITCVQITANYEIIMPDELGLFSGHLESFWDIKYQVKRSINDRRVSLVITLGNDSSTSDYSF